MKRLTAMLTAVAIVAVASNAAAEEAKVGDVTIEAPWARASAGMARTGAAFMTIVNDGSDDRLVAAAGDVAETVELHTHIKDGDIMRMRRIDAIEVPAGQPTSLAPGGLHVMLIGLRKPLKEGESFPLTLTFETAGTVTIDVPVHEAGAMGQGSMGAHGHGAMPKKDPM